jgi:hypothetical protein
MLHTIHTTRRQLALNIFYLLNTGMTGIFISLLIIVSIKSALILESLLIISILHSTLVKLRKSD